MVIHEAFWAFGRIIATVFVMYKLLATETSQRVGDEWANFNFQKAYIDNRGNCIPMESEDSGCSNYSVIIVFCASLTPCSFRLSTMSSTGVNLSSLHRMTPVMLFRVLWGDILTGILTSIDVFIRFL